MSEARIDQQHQRLRRLRRWLLPAMAGTAIASLVVFVRWLLYHRPEPSGEQLLGLAIAMPMGFAGLVADRYTRAKLAAGRQCPQCGYDLRASPERCPECGLEIAGHAEFVQSGGHRRPTRRQFIITFFAIFAGHLLLIPVWRVAVGAFGWGSLFAALHVMNAVLATIIFVRLVRGGSFRR